MGSAQPRVRRCAVLGAPVAHSLSPVMHRAAYAELGLPWTYESCEVDADELAGVLDTLDDSWRGLSLTMPLKRAAVSLCHDVSEVARRVGAVNTLVLDRGGRHGDNTDVPGFYNALLERGVHDVESAVVLGAGATAVSSAAALLELGLRRLHFAVRDPARAAPASEVVSRWGVQVSTGPLTTAGAWPVEPALLVSTVPAAASPDRTRLDQVRAVFDAVYDPWPTPLSEAARRAGALVLDGVDLLAHQARLQVRAMCGLDVDVDLLRDAARAELARRHTG